MQGRKQVKDRLRHHLPVRALRGRAENRKTRRMHGHRCIQKEWPTASDAVKS